MTVMKPSNNEESQGRPSGRPSDFNARVEGTLQVVLAIARAIEELGTVPSGHLYARLMGHLDIDAYQSVIATLVRAGLVRECANHLLEWAGPRRAALGSQETNNRKETGQ
jgi:hypothetical protein